VARRSKSTNVEALIDLIALLPSWAAGVGFALVSNLILHASASQPLAAAGEAVRLQVHAVTETGGGCADGGVDLVKQSRACSITLTTSQDLGPVCGELQHRKVPRLQRVGT
jgi:hypothetical protein